VEVDLEKELLSKINPHKIPTHVAIIMDGNGRWARKRGWPRLAGHKAGAKIVRMVIRAADSLKIKVLTLYAFSEENWQRPKREVSGLMRLLQNSIKKEVPELEQNKVKLQFLGRREKLSPNLQEEMKRAEERLKDNPGLILNIAINYGSRQEVILAIKRIVNEGKIKIDNLDEAVFNNYLYTANLPDPDLLIRTGGEFRVSNFLLWQIAYSELWFTPVFWPDFKKSHFLQAVIDFQKRERRFGTTKGETTK